MRKAILTMLLLSATLVTRANRIFENLEYTARLGYNIGGTMPIGMPASIRKLNKYKLKTDFSLGADVHTRFTQTCGVLTGLHVDNKAMEVDATVKGYHMAMVQENEKIEGYYTGSLVTECNTWALTLPLMFTFNAGEKVMLKFGPYVSWVMSRTFIGYVYDGYLRQNTPTGTRIEMDDNEETRATFDFSKEMRRFQFGLDLGIDWRIAGHWGAYADLKWGVNGIYQSSFKTIEQTLYPIFGTLGVIYKIK